MAEATAIVASWLWQPGAGILDPGERHWTLLTDLTREGQATGPIVMDAALAAIAIEHGRRCIRPIGILRDSRA